MSRLKTIQRAVGTTAVSFAMIFMAPFMACKSVSNATLKDADAEGATGAAGSEGTGINLTGDQKTQYARYLQDTQASLEMMRGRTGLIKDSVWICWDQDLRKPNFMDTEQLTSPTNIGLDLILLAQRALTGDQGDRQKAKATLAQLLQTLAGLDYHKADGLFFRTYWPDTGEASDINLSSVDNLHLAFGLWVVAHALRPADPDHAQIAQQLFDRMDFSEYYNADTGLIGGNMRPVDEDPVRKIKGDPQGPYKRDTFDYKYFGSEARSLYALGWALGLYRSASSTIPDFDQKLLGPGISGTVAETETMTTNGQTLKLLRTWDGGGFQALLPAVLVREDLYSPALGELHRAYARRLLSDAQTFGVPAAHSASAFGVKGLRIFRSDDPDFDKTVPIYNGAAGHIDMVATMHDDVNDPTQRALWDLAYTPHPAFMAASFLRDAPSASAFAQVLAQNETISSGARCVCRQAQGGTSASPAPRCECLSPDDLPDLPPNASGVVSEPNLCTVAAPADALQFSAADHLYQPGLGWMDGYYVKGPYQGKVVPVLISLDQAMIALSLSAILSPDGFHAASKALRDDPTVSARLQQAYTAIDGKISALPASGAAVAP